MRKRQVGGFCLEVDVEPGSERVLLFLFLPLSSPGVGRVTNVTIIGRNGKTGWREQPFLLTRDSRGGEGCILFFLLISSCALSIDLCLLMLLLLVSGGSNGGLSGTGSTTWCNGVQDTGHLCCVRLWVSFACVIGTGGGGRGSGGCIDNTAFAFDDGGERQINQYEYEYFNGCQYGLLLLEGIKSIHTHRKTLAEEHIRGTW